MHNIIAIRIIMEYNETAENLKAEQEKYMIYIMDKVILIILSAFMLMQRGSDIWIVVPLLITIAFSALNSCYERKRYVWINTTLCGACCLFMPNMIYMIPVFAYDVYTYRLLTPPVLMALGTFLHMSDASVKMWIYFGLAVILSCVMNRRSHRIDNLVQRVRKIRDDEEERNILLAEKNRNLLEKQDNEVYVATLKERNRIAREIHDNVGHVLTRTILQMGALMTVYKEEPLHGQLMSVKDNLDEAMNKVRDSVHDLHDESIDLRQSITEIAESLKSKYVYRVEYDITGRVDRQYKYAMIGIVREAVSNILKHSDNSNVDIILHEHPGIYQMVVYDYNADEGGKRAEGNGLDWFEALSKTGGIGMQNIWDRVQGLNGHVSVSRDNGFKIFVSLPKRKPI